ncbi:hypothetical protein JOL79_16375 [Microbispora sp. RL4-1S]|uniref:Uncharacterized protein n=1 Tax=Microbispora oryzae TaxID=2806554 RepID=A0A940WK58_9ACTN|nr:hypothetical protein [Microbispora oryzae]MBP2705392.1 hypothetical protein [Microbispora oryzae]
MRRHRFGRVAAALAAVYLAAVIALAVRAEFTGDVTLLWAVVVDQSGFMTDAIRPWWWLSPLLVVVAAGQSWAYWLVLRGRESGEPARNGRAVRLLRVTLYVDIGIGLLWLVPIPYAWWLSLVSVPVQLALAWLYFLVLRGTTPRWLRVLILVAGSLVAAHAAVSSVMWGLDMDLYAWLSAAYWGRILIWLVWMVSLLAAQARDPRWSPATVRFGVASMILSFFQPSGYVTVGFTNEVPWPLLFGELLGAVCACAGMVWSARSAHDLGSLRHPAPRSRPAPAPARRWPLPVVAIVLPLLPAAVNLLAHGTPFSLGPDNVLWDAVREVGDGELIACWFALDLLAGVGVPALLIVAVVLRRTRRLVRATVATLFSLAAACVVSAFTDADPFLPGELPFYPDSLFVKGGRLVSAGISPLWYAFAFTASALLLLFLYTAPPERRSRGRALVAVVALAVTLCLVPAADRNRGPITTAQQCSPPEAWEQPEQEQPAELTAEQRFVCSSRRRDNGLRQFSADTPDQEVLGYGRWICDLYTRDDRPELARLKLSRDALTGPLADICPSAAAVVRAGQAKQEREVAEMQAQAQAMCDATPRHRPRIQPAKAIRIREPQWTDYGVLQTYEGEEWDDAGLDPRNGLVSSQSGTLTVVTHSDFDLCVTLETYTRRPPVEIKGWDTVVEVGYQSPTGEIVLRDDLSGTVLPDLSLNGRKGHYRIRVHYAWFPNERTDKEWPVQRLLIMAYPARGDKEIVYRKKK